MKNTIAKTILILLAVFVLFGVWYDFKYSMETAPSFEVNTPSNSSKLLIATQGSVYKNFVVEGVLEELKPLDIFIRVIDVSELSNINSATWDAIFITHTWELGTAPNSVKNFIEQTKVKQKIITLATSGEGTNQIIEVDAITSASVIEEADNDVNILLGKIKAILQIDEISKSD